MSETKHGRDPSIGEVFRSTAAIFTGARVERPVTKHVLTSAPKFGELKFEPHCAGMGGIGCNVSFPNGYGASIIKTSFSYGGPAGLYELAVTKNGGGLCYTTPITNDVLGHMTESDVEAVLAKIAELPAVSP